MRSLFYGTLFFGLLIACDSKPEVTPPTPKENAAREPRADSSPTPAPAQTRPSGSPKTVYNVPERSETELAADLRAACSDAQKKGSPLLIEFSAPWCGDCRRLAEMKQEPGLAQALAKTPHYVVNIGHFDQHEALLDAFRVKAIAKWKVVSTDACDTPATGWKQLASRTLEPATGEEVVTSEDLTAWLKEKTGASPSL